MSSRPNHRPDRPLSSYPDAPRAELPPIGAPGEPKAASSAPAPRPSPRAAAALRFLDPEAIRTTVPLAFPFELDGREVRDIRLRRLTVAEVGSVMEGLGEDDEFDLWDFIAVMSDLPAPVLRGLIDQDGTEVLTRGRPLLPRAALTVFGLTENLTEAPASGTGGGLP